MAFMDWLVSITMGIRSKHVYHVVRVWLLDCNANGRQGFAWHYMATPNFEVLVIKLVIVHTGLYNVTSG